MASDDGHCNSEDDIDPWPCALDSDEGLLLELFLNHVGVELCQAVCRGVNSLGYLTLKCILLPAKVLA